MHWSHTKESVPSDHYSSRSKWKISQLTSMDGDIFDKKERKSHNHHVTMNHKQKYFNLFRLL